ncbi:hypothetical protein Patl1_04230 [Pistacia atlantica]|uniref:Uncharacterized protein n=1 Tax=Pistacia atlantica TaxID=434234 RepID=A0ACC1BUW6_9ROSI|nr:hypothetical protein Patl1_04230 [Pistacia atlantica]
MSTLLIFFLLLIPILFVLTRRRYSRKLPPGSLGIPIIGQSLGLLRAMRANTAEQWLEQRIRKYGPISKLSLFGTPTVFISGPAANRFIFTTDESTIANQQTKSLRMILGDRCLLILTGEDHKRVRGALVSFLKPESLKKYVGKIDEEVKKHLELHWHGKEQVTEGVWSIPVNLPFTRYHRGLRASRSVQNMVKDLIREKRMKLEQKIASPHDDLITCLLSIRDLNKEEAITEKEIVDNVMLVMIAGHDTSSVLITFMMRLLANDPTVFAAVLEEQEEVAKSKPMGELLTWEDLAKMKYTWRVALETLRNVSPIFGGFRKALKDIEFGGFLIPKGWQIFWVTHMTHMDDSIFPDPSKFDPDQIREPSLDSSLLLHSIWRRPSHMSRI